MGLREAEADGAEGGGEERRVHRPLQLAAEHALVHQVLERPEAGDVRLGLLERAVGLLQLLAHGGRAPAHLDLVGAEPMHQLVHEDVRKEGLEGDVLAIGEGKDHALVVGQVVGRRLHAAVAVAGGEDEVDHADGGERAQGRVAQRGRDGQVVLDVLQLRPEAGQLGRLRLVAHGDEGLEGGLGVEPLVLVDLVGPEGRLDAGVELHPGHVRVVVVVREEGLRAPGQERLQGGLRGQRGRLAQEVRRPRQLALVLEAVGHGRERAVRPAADGGEEPARGGLIRLPQRLHPGLDLVLGRARGIEVGRLRLGGHAGHEG